MKICTVILSLALAASVATAADAKSKAHHAAKPKMASTTDWPSNPYFDITMEQRDRFFRDAFNPAGAK